MPMSAQELERPFRLGGWRVNPASGRLTRIAEGDGDVFVEEGDAPARLTLRPKVMELLVYLASRAGDVVSNDDLIAHVWKDVHVTDASLYFTVNQLRAALGDDKEEPRYIKTLARRGYRLLVEPRPLAEDEADEPAAHHFGMPRLRIALGAVSVVVVVLGLLGLLLLPGGRVLEEQRRPVTSIAVLPFEDFSPESDQEYFADGLTEELINSLSKINDLSVMGRSSSFYYKDKARTSQQIGADLGVDNLLEGSVRRDGDRLRITAQLVESESGKTLWSESYDGTIGDIFAMQSDVASQVTRALSVTLLAEEVDALESYGTQNAEARSLYLRALAQLRNRRGLVSSTQANPAPAGEVRELLEMVVQLDSSYVEAWVALVQVYLQLSIADLIDAREVLLDKTEGLRRARNALLRAEALAPDAPVTLLASALVEEAAYSREGGTEIDRVFKAYERVLAADPRELSALLSYADLNLRFFRLEKAIALYERALEIDPLSAAALGKARALARIGRFGEARSQVRRVASLYPSANWQGGMADIEFVRGHLHHGILWSDASAEEYAYSTFALRSLGDESGAIVLLESYAEVGGGIADFIDSLIYFFRRDYAGLIEKHSQPNFLQTAPQGAAPAREGLNLALYRMREYKAYLHGFQHKENFYWNAAVTDPTPGFEQPNNVSVFIDIAWALKQTGRRAQAEAVRARVRQVIAKFLSKDAPDLTRRRLELEVLLLASEGKVEEALEALEALYATGWRWLMGEAQSTVGFSYAAGGFWFEDDPALDPIRDEPRFIAVMEKIKADNAAMLAELEAGLTLDDIKDETFEDIAYQASARGD